MVSEKNYGEEEETYEENKLTMGWPAGGYLIGRHIECGELEHSVMLEHQDLTCRRSCTESTNHIESSLPPFL